MNIPETSNHIIHDFVAYEEINSPTGSLISFLNRDLVYEEVNDAYLYYWQKSRQEIVGRSISELVGETNYKSSLEPLLMRCLEGQVVGYQAWYDFPGLGRRFIDVIYNPSKDEFGSVKGIMVSVHDITKAKQTEQALEEALQKLEKSNEDLTHFAYIASHDLQEPLRMITSYLSLLEKKYAANLDERAQKFIYFAVDGALRMQTLINDLLSYSRVTTRGQAFLPTNLEKVLQKVLNNLEVVIAESAATISIGSLPTMEVDSTQMIQLFQNLIGNALKFRSAEPPAVEIDAHCEGEYWVFCVADNGIGIEKKFHEDVFAIFKRLHTRSEYEGTGIGLALCQRIIERHGGRIWLESTKGNGTKVFFTLPRQEQDNDAAI